MNHRTTKAMFPLLGLTLALLAAGCAGKTTTEIDAANAALEPSARAEAEAPAPSAIGGVRDAHAESEAELVTQKARREDATNALAELRTSLDEARTKLDNAPKGKGSAADLVALRNDLRAVDAAVTEIQQAIVAERFLDAIQKAQTAMERTDEIRAEIERAAEAQRAARRT